MARQKAITSIDTAITKTKEDLAKVQAKYDKLSMELQNLQKQRPDQESKLIIDAYDYSGKSLNEIMIFLGA